METHGFEADLQYLVYKGPIIYTCNMKPWLMPEREAATPLYRGQEAQVYSWLLTSPINQYPNLKSPHHEN